MQWQEIVSLSAKQLASELFHRGLAPRKVEVLQCADGPFYYYGPPRDGRWNPTAVLDDVAHLIERFMLTIRPGQHGGYVVGHQLITEKAPSIKGIPMLICRVALYLYDQEESHE